MAGTIQNLKQDAVAQIYLKKKKLPLREASEQSNCHSVFFCTYIFFQRKETMKFVSPTIICCFLRIFTSFLLLGNKIASLLKSCCIQLLAKSLKK